MQVSSWPFTGRGKDPAQRGLQEYRVLRSAQYEPLIQALFRATDYGVLMTDTEGTDILCNPRFGVLFGIDAETVVRLPREEVRAIALSRVRDADAFGATMERAYADPRLEFEDDIEVIYPGNTVLRRHTAPVLDTEGRVLGRVWTFLDVTETRRLQAEVGSYAKHLELRLAQQAEALKTAHDELLEAARMQAVGTLAMGIAHDLRNILTTLRLEISSLDDAPYQALARQQLDRLYALTHSLLALTEDAPLLSGPVDVSEILDFVFGLVRGQAEVDGVRLRKRVTGKIPPVQGNPRRLEHLFVNLLRNGLNAVAAQGGTITASIRCDGGQVRVDVSDTGPGIAPEHLPRLFEPFFSTRANHTGLGLFSARRIVEAHRGSIRIESKANKGTRVSVWLPLAELPSVEPEDEPGEKGSKGTDERKAPAGR
ncbi:MAG: ATP-binding protein [Capsulimonadales bacterium]|nr:ATP-binding protein [Capsulimonadales bacterium]